MRTILAILVACCMLGCHPSTDHERAAMKHTVNEIHDVKTSWSIMRYYDDENRVMCYYGGTGLSCVKVDK